MGSVPDTVLDILYPLSLLILIPAQGDKYLIPIFQIKKCEFQGQFQNNWVSETNCTKATQLRSVKAISQTLVKVQNSYSLDHKLPSDKVLDFPNPHISIFRLGTDSFTSGYVPNSTVSRYQAGAASGLGGDSGSGETMVAFLKRAAAIQLWPKGSAGILSPHLLMFKRHCKSRCLCGMLWFWFIVNKFDIKGGKNCAKPTKHVRAALCEAVCLY